MEEYYSGLCYRCNQSLAIGRGRWLLLAAPLVAILAGCSNNPYPLDEANSNIRYAALGEDPKTLDPNVCYDESAGSVLANVCDTFLQYHYLKRNPLVLIPSMGARMPDRKPYTFTEQVAQTDPAGQPMLDRAGKPVVQGILRHGEIWTFTLKPGLRYGDDPCFPGGKGREVLAADFVYSLKRMADPTVGCPILSYLVPHIIGLQEFADAQIPKLVAAKQAHKQYTCDFSTPVAGLQVDPANPYVFRIILRDAYPEMKYLMAMTLTAPVPHEAVEFYNRDGQNGMRKHPVGAGPYRLVEWTEKQRLILEQNPYFKGETYPVQGAPGDLEAGLLEDAGKPLPLTPKIVFTIVKNSLVGWNLFQQGYMDSWGVPHESFEQVITRQGTLSEEMKSRGIRLDTVNGMDVSYFAFNMEDPVVGGYTDKKRKLRQAISLAFNTGEYLDLMTHGLGVPAQGPLPPGVFGYEPGYKNPYRQTLPDGETNLVKAKLLLSEAGYPDGIDASTGKPLEIFYDDAASTPEGLQASGLVIRQLQQLGIKINERSSTYAVFMQRVDKGQFQLMSFGWVADYPDPENFFLLFYGPNKGPGPNAARYSNPEFDRLYDKMVAMDDTPDRLAIIRKMRTILQEDCPWIDDSHSVDPVLRYNWLKNAKSHPVALNTAKYLRIDYRLRARMRAQWNQPRYDIIAEFLAALILGTVPAILTVRHRRRTSVRMLGRTLARGTGKGPRIL